MAPCPAQVRQPVQGTGATAVLFSVVITSLGALSRCEVSLTKIFWVRSDATDADSFRTRRAPSKRRFQYEMDKLSTRTSAPGRGEWMNFPSPT